MLTGEIKWFNAKKNYGFIVPHTKGKDVFFYGTEFEPEHQAPTLKPQQWVEYEAIETAQGPRAEKVSLCKKRGEHERSAARENERKNVI